MEIKKYQSADTEKKRSTNMLIGLNTGLALILGLFLYSNAPEVAEIVKKSASNSEVEVIPPTDQPPPKTPPPPPSPEIKVLEDDTQEDDDFQATDVTIDDAPPAPPPPPAPSGDGPKIVIDNTIYTDVDVEGEYEGGEDKLLEFANTFYKMPRAAQELGISGIILIQFVVEKDGSISDVKAAAPKDRQLGYGLEEEAIKVVKLTSGKWKPASKAGKPVRSYWRFPFQIENGF